MNKIFKIILLFLSFLLILGLIYFFIGTPPRAKKTEWGINFSQKHAQNLGLDWKETYSALLGELGAKNIKLAAYWDLIEPNEGQYDFDDLDWQISEAEKYQAEIILVIGSKTPRWPECHEPEWLKIQNSKSLPRRQAGEIRNSYLLEYIEKIVDRYKNSRAITAWQVENEPFFKFGLCEKNNSGLLQKEVEMVKSKDLKSRPIIITDSGEFSFWFKAAETGDAVGITMYEKTWFKEIKNYVRYYLPSVFYWRKTQIIKKLFDKEVFVAELQAEPWCPNLIYNCSLNEQKKTMNLEQFRKNIEFAQSAGFDRFYLWGAEWWYWLKEKQNKPEIWEEAKKNIIWTSAEQPI